MRSDSVPPSRYFHDDVRNFVVGDDVVHGDDVAVRQRRHRAAFEQETTLELLGFLARREANPFHHLDRDLAVERALRG
jgi:hypothetical protein